MLLKCIQATEGGVLEMGTGLFSTPFLHWLCSEKQRRLISYEDNYDFYRLARIFQNRFHRIRLVEDWDKLDIGGHWSVALIDNSTKYRASMAIALKDKVDYVVMHDTNDPVHYRYQYVWSHFKYRYDDTRQSPWTSVVSNFENLKWLEEKIL
jgi:hypothetical protein